MDELPGEPPGSYDKFLKDSECRAFKNEKKCEEDLLKTCPAKDRPDVQTWLNDTEKQIEEYCGKKGRAK